MAEPRVPFREGFVPGPKGIKLFYRQDGETGPALVCCNGVGVSTFFWEPFSRLTREKYRVVRWDYRGHGRSDSPHEQTDISIDTCVEDLKAVLDGLGLEKAVLLGHSMGSQVIFEFYRKYPERVLGLVPTLGPYRRAVETFLDTSASLVAFSVMKGAISVAPHLLSRGMRPFLVSGVAEKAARTLGIVDRHLAPRALLLQYMEHMLRLDLVSYAALAESMQVQDATDLLPHIQVPVLVIAGERDIFCPVRLAFEMIAAIPNSELLVIPRGTHAALIEQPELMTLRIEKFLKERVFA